MGAQVTWGSTSICGSSATWMSPLPGWETVVAMGAVAGAGEVASFGADISIVDMCRELPPVQLFLRFFEEDGENKSNGEPFNYSTNLILPLSLAGDNYAGWWQRCMPMQLVLERMSRSRHRTAFGPFPPPPLMLTVSRPFQRPCFLLHSYFEPEGLWKKWVPCLDVSRA